MKTCFFGIGLLVIFASCANTPKVDHGYPHIGSSNNALIAVKDYETLGIIFVKSTEIMDDKGNHTGSKITHEMLMKEAQKLGADDVINIKIDINQIVDIIFETPFGGETKRTTYNYTASALAIKYTSAVISDNRGYVSENFEKNDITYIEMDRSIEKTLAPIRSSVLQSSNTRNNWLSAGATMLGAGIKCERLLNSYWSIGADAYYQYYNFLLENEAGVDITSRLYPFGMTTLYIGIGIGYHGYYGINGYISSLVDGFIWEEEDYSWGYIHSIAITPEIGWKIRLGKQGDFYVEPCLKLPIFSGLYGAIASYIPYVGFGWVL